MIPRNLGLGLGCRFLFIPSIWVPGLLDGDVPPLLSFLPCWAPALRHLLWL
jgi:hypothetical protein